jgi:peroxiredoxin
MVRLINNKELKGRKCVTGMYVKNWSLQSIAGETIEMPDKKRLIHLQFRRFAGCPVCNLHLHRMAKQWTQLSKAGILQVVVFHSTRDELLKYSGNLPFHMIADPEKKLYKAFGVESSLLAVLIPLVFFPIVRSVLHSFFNYLAGKQPFPPLKPKGGSLGLPADFLIGTDGKIIEAKYGKHADDQWSSEEVLELSAPHRYTQ